MPTKSTDIMSFADFLKLDKPAFIDFMERGGGQRVTLTPEELVNNVGRAEREHPGDVALETPAKECTAARQMEVTTGIEVAGEKAANR